MGREIKFRAWVPKPRRMLYKLTRLFFGDNGEPIQFRTETPEPLGARQDLQPFILMQYTGLKDKNGVEIYEGDIYKVNDFFIHGPVTFVYPSQDGNLLAGTDRLRCNAHPTKNSTEFTSCDAWNCEVIGNIYENPELLEKA
jgi:uncharacterized phage protein (TIGR01671 family)